MNKNIQLSSGKRGDKHIKNRGKAQIEYMTWALEQKPGIQYEGCDGKTHTLKQWILDCLKLLMHSGAQIQFDTASYPKPYSEINYLYRITAILDGMVFCQEADDMEVCMRELIKEMHDQTETPEDLKLNLKEKFLDNQLHPAL